MTFLDRIRSRAQARRARARPLTCVPVVLTALCVASLPPAPELVKKAEELAALAGAKLSTYIDPTGMFVGFGLMRDLRKSVPAGFSLIISVDTFSYNIHNAAVSAGWDGTTPTRISVTINSTIFVGANGSGFGMVTGSFPTGTLLTLTNLGYLVGYGGAGGNGGNGTDGTAGTAGGTALSLSYPITIDNTNGYIYGGSGGGGGGASWFAGGAARADGGGGGGGIGFAGGVAGNAGAVGSPGSGFAGTRTSGGDGGVGGFDGTFSVSGGNGGRCQFFGWASTTEAGFNTANHNGGAAGGPGNAITTNGNAITWLGGNNPTQVVGAVV